MTKAEERRLRDIEFGAKVTKGSQSSDDILWLVSKVREAWEHERDAVQQRDARVKELEAELLKARKSQG